MLPALERDRSRRSAAGGGVPQAAYPDDAYVGMARFTAAWFDHRLLESLAAAAARAARRGSSAGSAGPTSAAAPVTP